MNLNAISQINRFSTLNFTSKAPKRKKASDMSSMKEGEPYADGYNTGATLGERYMLQDKSDTFQLSQNDAAAIAADAYSSKKKQVLFIKGLKDGFNDAAALEDKDKYDKYFYTRGQEETGEDTRLCYSEDDCKEKIDIPPEFCLDGDEECAKSKKSKSKIGKIVKKIAALFSWGE